MTKEELNLLNKMMSVIEECSEVRGEPLTEEEVDEYRDLYVREILKKREESECQKLKI